MICALYCDKMYGNIGYAWNTLHELLFAVSSEEWEFIESREGNNTLENDA